MATGEYSRGPGREGIPFGIYPGVTGSEHYRAIYRCHLFSSLPDWSLKLAVVVSFSVWVCVSVSHMYCIPHAKT